VDPVNNATYYYAYAATSTGGVYYFEISASIESKKYGVGGTNDIISNDGSASTSSLIVGSKPGLTL
jgi:hypothetical protein